MPLRAKAEPPLGKQDLRRRAPRVPAAPRSPKLSYPWLKDKVVEPGDYYATMYDHTGAPMARTFVGVDEDEELIVAHRIPHRRVFIGTVQEQWGLGSNPRVFVEATPVLARKAPKRGHERYYVGKQSVLSLRVRRRPPLPMPTATPGPPVAPPVPVHVPLTPAAEPAPEPTSIDLDDDFGSPLSSLDDTDTAGEGDGQGELGQWITSEPADGGDAQKLTEISGMDCYTPGVGCVRIELTERDIAKAIYNAFTELGLVTVMPTDL